MKILFTGGGTGGHIFPIIAIARELQRALAGEKLELLYVGPKDKWGPFFLSQEGIQVKTILAGKVRRYFSPLALLQNIIDVLLKIPLGTLQALFHIFFWGPDLIFSKGGYGSIPVVFSGWLLQVPIFLHESDIAPGLTNKILSKFALEIFVSFPKTEYFPQQKMILVGNPIREGLLKGSLEEAKNFFRLRGEKPVLLVLGGSQGAQRINDGVLEILTELLLNFELIHQTGEANFEQVRAEAGAIVPTKLKEFYHAFAFLKEKELGLAYRAADLVIGRAGAGIVFEIASLAKPSILIPLPEAAQNHQLKNAYSFSQNRACLVIEEANFTSHFFLEKLKYLFSHPAELETMAARAREFARPRAAKIIAGYILTYLKV